MKKHWDDNPQTLESEHTLPARVPARFAIGPVEVRPATVLAPMAGVTDTIFRRFIRNARIRAGGQQARHARMDRQPRHATPERRDRTIGAHRAEHC